jgi:hypothetical protein
LGKTFALVTTPAPPHQKKRKKKKREKEKEKDKVKKRKRKVPRFPHTNVYRCRESAIIKKKQHKKIHAER